MRHLAIGSFISPDLGDEVALTSTLPRRCLIGIAHLAAVVVLPRPNAHGAHRVVGVFGITRSPSVSSDCDEVLTPSALIHVRLVLVAVGGAARVVGHALIFPAWSDYRAGPTRRDRLVA